MTLQETVVDSAVASNYYASVEGVSGAENGYQIIHYHTFAPSVISMTPVSTSLGHVTTVKSQDDITSDNIGASVSSVNVFPNMVPSTRKSMAVGVPTSYVESWGSGVIPGETNDYSMRHEITFHGNEDTTPVVDGQVFGMTLNERIVNFSTNAVTGSTGYNGELESNATDNDYTPDVRYITKPITLSTGLGATNLYVTLTQYMPSSTEIQVFTRYLAENSEEQIRNQRWEQMWLVDTTGNTGSLDPSDVDNLTYSITPFDLRDIQYRLPADVDGGLGEYQIKFVLHANVNRLIHPVVLNMRSIAVI